MSVKPRVNLILDCLILVAFLLTFFSGHALEAALRSTSVQSEPVVTSIFEAGSVNPAAHLHMGASTAFVALIVVHQFFHWKWITSQIKQLMRGSWHPSRASQAQER